MIAGRELPRIAGRLWGEPWALRAEMYGTLLEQFVAAAEGERLTEPVLEAEAMPKAGALRDRVERGFGLAIVPVHGIIGKHLSGLEMMCGGFCLAALDEELQTLIEDEATETVIMDFRTPGGVAIGAIETVSLMEELRESGKRVIGYSDYEVASLGYWLAAGCDELHCAPSTVVGSISTYAAGVDSSGAWEKEGLQLELVRTGRIKARGMPGKEWTEEEREDLRERIEACDAEFKEYVRQRRGLDEELMQGQWWFAHEAPAGVVDSTQFRSLRELVEAVLEGQT